MVAIGILVGVVPSWAQVQAKLQAAIFVKLLNYDASMVKKPQPQIKFHIILDSKTSSQKDALKSSFSVIASQKVANKKVVVTATPVSSLSGAITAESAHIFYLPDGSTNTTLNTVLQSAIGHKIPVLAGNAELAQNGAGVGITIANGKPQIIVNLKQSKAQGMNLSSQLLKLAKVI